MIGQKDEKKLSCEARFADQSAAPKTSPQWGREQIVGPKIDPAFGARFGVAHEFSPYAYAP